MSRNPQIFAEVMSVATRLPVFVIPVAASVISLPWAIVFVLAILTGNMAGVWDAMYRFPIDTEENSSDLYDVSL
jgi:hypothetical protein